MKRSYFDLFSTINLLFMIVFSLSMLYPFLYLLVVSINANGTLMSNFMLMPNGITFESYESILKFKYIQTGFFQSVLRVFLGTSISVIACTLTAYPLAKRNLPFRSFLTMFMVFTMFFAGGLIPNYLLIVNLGLIDSIWSLVLPSLIPTFSMLIMRNYFMSLPVDLEESAKIDGAGDWKVLFQIIVPLSRPIVATIVLWEMVYHWNAWFDSMIYIRDAKNQVLQLVMRNIVISGQIEQMGGETNVIADAQTPEKLKAATIMIATVPILCVYPFLQRYFIKGIIMGSLKG
jgi:putative aldouronate transport system permease protein